MWAVTLTIYIVFFVRYVVYVAAGTLRWLHGACHALLTRFWLYLLPVAPGVNTGRRVVQSECIIHRHAFWYRRMKCCPFVRSDERTHTGHPFKLSHAGMPSGCVTGTRCLMMDSLSRQHLVLVVASTTSIPVLLVYGLRPGPVSFN